MRATFFKSGRRTRGYAALRVADWCEAYYANSQGNEVPIFEVPLSKIVNITGATFAPDSANPLVLALKAFAFGDRQPEQAQQVLQSFYNDFQPRTLAGLVCVGGGEQEESLPLFDIKKQQVTMPWDAQVRTSDYKYIGPKRDEQIKHTSERLIRIFKAIESEGWAPKVEDHVKHTFPTGQVLVQKQRTENSPFFLLKSGHHRISALAALGYSSVSVGFRPGLPPIVREEDVGFWPQVRKGNLADGEALDVFASLVSGGNRRIQRWQDEVLNGSPNDTR